MSKLKTHFVFHRLWLWVFVSHWRTLQLQGQPTRKSTAYDTPLIHFEDYFNIIPFKQCLNEEVENLFQRHCSPRWSSRHSFLFQTQNQHLLLLAEKEKRVCIMCFPLLVALVLYPYICCCSPTMQWPLTTKAIYCALQ